MKALSIKQPWASLIAHGLKPIENRTWRTKFRGRIYIHASMARFNPNPHPFSKEQLKIIQKAYASGNFPSIDQLPYSAIVGEVDIIDCVRNHLSIWAEPDPIFDPKKHKRIPKMYHWVLENAVSYEEPILNVNGALSLWEFNKCKI